MATQLKTINGFFINIKDGYELKEAYVLACTIDRKGDFVITEGAHKSKKTGEVTVTRDIIFSNDADGVFVYVPEDRIDEIKLVKDYLTIFRPVILPSVKEVEDMMS